MKGGDAVYITLDDLIQMGILIVAIIAIARHTDSK